MKTFISAILVIFFAFFQETRPVTIDWKENLKGDFSFRKKWSYAGNVFKNKYGELICDGFCDDTLQKMEDKNGRIKKQFRKAYYQFLDTTHYYHTYQPKEAWCYGYGDVDFMEAVRKGKDTVVCSSEMGGGVYSSLRLTIVQNKCYPTISFISPSRRIGEAKSHTFLCTNGNIQIDKNLWQKGVLKASFSFNFKNHLNPNYPTPMYWKGLIYTKIKEK